MEFIVRKRYLLKTFIHYRLNEHHQDIAIFIGKNCQEVFRAAIKEMLKRKLLDETPSF